MKIIKIIAIAAVIAPIHVGATTCLVNPGDLVLNPGLSTTAQLMASSTTFDLSIGALPRGVTARISQNGANWLLELKTETSVQLGSFSIPVKINGYEKPGCQFNLKIEKNGTTPSTPTTSVKPLPPSPTPVETSVKTLPPAPTPVETLVKPLPPTANPVATLVRSLRRGTQGLDVKALQEQLKSLKFFPAGEDTTEYFGILTEKAVREFQKSKGIDPIGIVGPKTRAELNKLK